MYKILSIVLIFLFLIPFVTAYVSVGIFPAKVEIEVPPLNTINVAFHILNPSQNELNLKIKFYCKNCEREIILFNRSIGRVLYDLDVKVFPSNLKVTKSFSNETVVVFLRINNPLFSLAKYQVRIGDTNIHLPVVIIFIDKNMFDGLLILESTNNNLKLEITSSVKITYIGINSFTLILSFVVLILSLVIYYRIKILRLIKSV